MDHDQLHELRVEMVAWRQKENNNITVYIEDGDLHVYTNAGRPIRPLMVVKEEKYPLVYIDAGEAERATVVEAD